MKKLRLISIILIAAVCVMVALSGCNTTIYPNIEDISEVFTAISEIENYDCDIFLTYAGENEEAVYNTYNSLSLKLIKLTEDKFLTHFYHIQQPIKVYAVDNKVFYYNEDELKTEAPSFVPASPFIDGLQSLSYTASYPVTNRTTFEAEYVSDLSKLGKLAANIDADSITKCTVTIETDNHTTMPVSIVYNLDSAFTDPTGELDYIGVVQIKYVFKKVNKPILLEYPEEVKTYLDKNYPITEEQE